MASYLAASLAVSQRAHQTDRAKVPREGARNTNQSRGDPTLLIARSTQTSSREPALPLLLFSSPSLDERTHLGGPTRTCQHAVWTYAAQASLSSPRYPVNALMPHGHADGWQIGANAETLLYIPGFFKAFILNVQLHHQHSRRTDT